MPIGHLHACTCLVRPCRYYCSCVITFVVDDMSKADGIRYFRYRDVCTKQYGGKG